MAKVGRPKGSIKTGGRKAGSKNRVSNDLDQRLKEHDFDIVAEAIKLFKHFDTKPEIKFKTLQLLTEYTMPKPKSEDLDAPRSAQPTVSWASQKTNEELLKEEDEDAGAP